MLTAELNETDAIAEAEADQNRARPHRWTKEEAREAARLSRGAAQRAVRAGAPFRRGNRTWFARAGGLGSAGCRNAASVGCKGCALPRPPAGVDLDSMSETKLERLYAGLVRLASMDETVFAALVEQVLADGAVIERVTRSRA